MTRAALAALEPGLAHQEIQPEEAEEMQSHDDDHHARGHGEFLPVGQEQPPQ